MKHCMLLWKKPSAKPLQTQIDCAFDVFSVIRDLREEYSPHFYKANKKKTSQPIAWSADAFMEALKKNPVNKGNQLLGELGYSISMYSSQAESSPMFSSNALGFFSHIGGVLLIQPFFKKARAYCPLVCHRRCIGLTFGLIQFLMELDESES